MGRWGQEKSLGKAFRNARDRCRLPVIQGETRISESTFEHVFIGDVHGHAPTLLALLDQLGWKPRNGRLSSPGGQQLVFVGDLIDRGPENLRTVEIVRDLVERGEARCVMGNHEYNAVQFHTEHPDRPGETLREQSPENIKQHQKVLDEIERSPGDWQDMLDWFRTLPMALEGETWRCVHACWSPPISRGAGTPW